MGGRVARTFHGVVGGGDHFSADLDHRADGHFVLPPRVDCLVVGEAHEEHVVAHQLRELCMIEVNGAAPVRAMRFQTFRIIVGTRDVGVEKYFELRAAMMLDDGFEKKRHCMLV